MSYWKLASALLIAGGAYLYDRFSDQKPFSSGIKRLLGKVENKNVSVIGGAAVGKTTFIHLIQHSKLPTVELASTSSKSRVSPFESEILKVGNVNIRVQNLYDISGGESARDHLWEDLLRDADVIFYLCKVSNLIETDAKNARIKKDLEHISKYKNKDKNPKLIVMATHTDNYDGTSTRISIQKKCEESTRLSEVRDENNFLLVCCSLKDECSASEAIQRINEFLS